MYSRSHSRALSRSSAEGSAGGAEGCTPGLRSLMASSAKQSNNRQSVQCDLQKQLPILDCVIRLGDRAGLAPRLPVLAHLPESQSATIFHLAVSYSWLLHFS